MPVVQLPSGEYVNVADGTTPERMQQIFAEDRAATAAKMYIGADGRTHHGEVDAATKHMRDQMTQHAQINRGNSSDDQRVHNFDSGPLRYAAGYLRGATFNFNDELQGGMSAATRGVYDAVRTGDIGEIGRRYTRDRDVVRAVDRHIDDTAGAGDVTAEIAGSLLSPTGLAGKGVKAAGYGVDALTGGRIASAVAGSTRAQRIAEIATAIAKPVPVQAALVGAGYGGLNALGSSDNKSIGDVVNGALMGGVTGGVLGGAFHGGSRVLQTLRDRGENAASRNAVGRIADYLERTPVSPGSDTRFTPIRAERELAVANGRGTDTMMADLSPSLQAQAAKLARKPENPASVPMIQRAEQRAAQRPEEMQQRISQDVQPRTGTDAVAFQEANTAARKAAGTRDYEAALNKPINWSPELDAFVNKPNPLVQTAIKHAYDALRSQDINPTTVGLVFGPDGVLMKVKRPTMAAFDYLKKGLDQVTQTARAAGNNDMARIAGNQANALRDMVIKANPEYGAALATQRAHFSLSSAADLGRDVVKRLTGNRADPRVLLSDIRKVDPADRDALRTGFADALMSLRDERTAGRGPVAVLQSMMKSPNQRTVLENLFEGRGNLGRFEKWLDREVRAAKTDAMVAGPQSITSLMTGVDLAPQGAGRILFDAARGQAFGGPMGAVTGAVRSLANVAGTHSKATADEIARLLMSNGEGFAQQASAAQTYRAERAAANARRAKLVAKGGQQIFTDAIGQHS